MPLIDYYYCYGVMRARVLTRTQTLAQFTAQLWSSLGDAQTNGHLQSYAPGLQTDHSKEYNGRVEDQNNCASGKASEHEVLRVGTIHPLVVIIPVKTTAAVPLAYRSVSIYQWDRPLRAMILVLRKRCAAHGAYQGIRRPLLFPEYYCDVARCLIEC